jgi:lipoprotein-anchoring transpeptidase ErfK/SrfK
MKKTLGSVAILLVLFVTMAAAARADWVDGTAAGAPAAAPLAAQEPNPQKRIEVIRSSQHLIAWEGEQIAFEAAVTTGQEGQETLTGDFEILDKEADAYSHAWNLALPSWLGVYQVGEFENGFHALPITPKGEVLWEDALGVFPASHGCIVLSASDAQRLFDWAEIGTPVNIHD